VTVTASYLTHSVSRSFGVVFDNHYCEPNITVANATLFTTTVEIYNQTPYLLSFSGISNDLCPFELQLA